MATTKKKRTIRKKNQKPFASNAHRYERHTIAPAEIVHVVPSESHYRDRHAKAREKHWADVKARVEKRFVDLGRGETLYQKLGKKK